MKKYLGILAALSSALIFGFTPMLGKLSYAGGSNGTMLTFLRAAFAIPVLYAILKAKGIPLAITKEERRALFCIAIPGPAMTTVLLYSSYHYIPTGIATVLHFFYPVVVTLAELLIFKKKVSGGKTAALLLGFAGILLFFDWGVQADIIGILLALASSITYSIYMLGVERTSLRGMHHFKLSLYFCLFSLAASFLLGCFTDTLNFRLTGEAWFYSFLVSMFVSVGAITLFQLGIQLIGASSTAIFSTLEPITSVVFGVLFLSEAFSTQKAIGCALVLLGVILITLLQAKESGKAGGNKAAEQ